MKKQAVIEHLLRLSMIIRLFHFSTNKENIYTLSEKFLEVLNTIIDDLIITSQSESGKMTFLIQESMTLSDDKLVDLLSSSKKYIEENKEGLDKYSMDMLLSKMTKFIYKLKLT